MATISERKLKNGQQVFDVQVYVNGKLKSASWRRPKEITDNREAKRLATKFACEFEERIRNQQTDFGGKTTFAEYAAEWLKDCFRNNSLTSYSRNKEIIKDVNRFIGDIPLVMLKPTHVKKVLDYLNDRTITTETAILKKPLDEIIKGRNIRQISVDAGFSFTTFLFVRRKYPILWSNALKLAKTLNINASEYFEKVVKTRPFSKGSKEKYKRVINAILNRAVQLELIKSNPAKKVFVKNAISGEEKEKDILSLAETEQFENALLSITEKSKLREKAAIALLFYMAMRLGEVAGLEWKDIDFEKGTISIKRSAIYINHEFSLIEKPPKTKTSKRTIKMPKVMQAILEEYKVWYDEQKKMLDDLWVNTDKVIARWNGETITPQTMRQWLHNLLNKNGIRIVSPHSLRHTNITIQLRNKIPPKAVARFAGHSDASVTLNVYSHFLEEDEDEYVNLFDNLFKKKA